MQFVYAYSIIITSHGGVAQLGARLNGIQKVEGSIPFISTTEKAVKSLISRPFSFVRLRSERMHHLLAETHLRELLCENE